MTLSTSPQPESAALTAEEVAEASRKASDLAHPPSVVAPEALGVVSGLAAGAAAGALAGPPGIVVGAVLGTAFGAVAGALWRERDEEDRMVEEQLDKDIGIIDGSLGEANPNAPPAKIGAFSTAAMGAGGGGGTVESPDGGPLPGAHEDT